MSAISTKRYAFVYMFHATSASMAALCATSSALLKLFIWGWLVLMSSFQLYICTYTIGTLDYTAWRSISSGCGTSDMNALLMSIRTSSYLAFWCELKTANYNFLNTMINPHIIFHDSVTITLVFIVHCYCAEAARIHMHNHTENYMNYSA